MAARYGELRDLGAEVLVVSFSPPDKLVPYLARTPLPFPAVSDPERQAYRAFGLTRARWWRVLNPWLLLSYLLLKWRNRLPAQPYRGEDVLQLGGDFVLDPVRRLVYAHRSATPMDRPTVAELIEAVRKAG